jgi:hypothetical protein
MIEFWPPSFGEGSRERKAKILYANRVVKSQLLVYSLKSVAFEKLSAGVLNCSPIDKLTSDKLWTSQGHGFSL